MYGSITLYIYNVTHFVRLQVSREVFHTCLSKLFREQVSGSPTFTMWISHCGFILISVTICSLIFFICPH